MVPGSVLEVVAKIYGAPCRNNDDTWSDVALSVERAFARAAVALCLPHPRGSNAGYLVAPSYDERMIEEYAPRYAALNPLSPHVERLAVGSCEYSERCVPEASFERSEFHREWMAPQGLAPGTLGGIIDRDDVGTWAIVICRRKNARHFVDADLRLARLLLPHLQKALHLTRLIGGFEQRERALAKAVDILPTGVVLMRKDGSIAVANRAAEQMLKANDGIGIGSDGPCAATGADTQTLRRLIGEAIESAQGSGLRPDWAMSLPRPSLRRPLQVLLVPFRTDTQDFGPEPPVVAMLLTDPDAIDAEPDALLTRLYRLTPAESALARALAAGTPLSSAAEQLGITRETARSRLKVLFSKTSTHRQAELVSLLLHGHWKIASSEEAEAR